MDQSQLEQFYSGDGEYPCYRPEVKIGNAWASVSYIRKITRRTAGYNEFEIKQRYGGAKFIVNGKTLVRWPGK